MRGRRATISSWAADQARPAFTVASSPRRYAAGMRIALAVLLITASARADAPHACPAAVTASVHKAFPDARLGACKAERDHGKDVFEVALTRPGGAKLAVDVAPGGEILQIEEAIAVDALPDAVKRAFAAKYPKATPRSAEKQTAGKDVRYEIAFQTDHGGKEATFTADGHFVDEE
jgi:hypothetical protein